MFVIVIGMIMATWAPFNPCTIHRISRQNSIKLLFIQQTAYKTAWQPMEHDTWCFGNSKSNNSTRTVYMSYNETFTAEMKHLQQSGGCFSHSIKTVCDACCVHLKKELLDSHENCIFNCKYFNLTIFNERLIKIAQRLGMLVIIKVCDFCHVNIVSVNLYSHAGFQFHIKNEIGSNLACAEFPLLALW